MKTRDVPFVLLLTAFSATAMGNGLGIASWAGWQPGQISKADNPHLRSVPLILGWDDLEPVQDSYAFDEIIGGRMIEAADDDLYVTLMIWVRPTTPMWLFDELGVPRVYTDRTVDPLGNPVDPEDTLHPYYFDQAYSNQFFELIDEFGTYVSGLPQELRERIVFVQSAEGSTGDGQPYKGNPTNSLYEISNEDWNVFRRQTWQRYQQALPGIPILVNSDANTEEENNWMLENMDVIANKYGMFSHGWHISDGIQRLADFRALEAQAKALGKPVLTRGEQDGELYVYGWATNNIPLALYWGGLYATHNQLDLWNVPKDVLKDSANFETCRFFNRYAGLHNPAASPRAFCALRDGLNAADDVRFPATYGTVSKSNEQRYINIAAAYAAYGARMEDPPKATGGGMVNRKRNGYNDAGWNILPGNYFRFLTQIEPGSGDVGWWHVDVMKQGSSYADASIYSRFARGFENAAGKNAMYFDLSDELAGGMTNTAAGVDLKVIYRDGIAGSTWELRYDNGSGSMACALAVTNSGTGDWKSIETTVFDGEFGNGGPGGADLALINTDSLDDIFHLIEAELQLPPAFTSNRLIKPGGTVGQPYSATLADDAADVNGDLLQFSLLPGGPSWLSVSTSGILAGTPGAGGVGLNHWTLQVMDDRGGTVTAELLMVVDEEAPNSGWFELLYDDFETGFGNWVSGGPDAFLSVNNAIGTQGIEIQDNDGVDSSISLAAPLDLTGYTQLEIGFTYYPNSIDDSGDGFLLEFSADGGASWSTLKYFAVGTDFENNVRENPVLTFDSAATGFTASSLLRFRCDSSGPVDDIFIDNVKIYGLIAGNQRPVFSLDPLAKPAARAGLGYSGSLAADATDPEVDAMMFSKFSGPAWLSVASNGKLSGTPKSVDVGDSSWCVKVVDESGDSDYAMLTISVSPGIPLSVDPRLFSADFSGSTLNTNAFSNSTPIPIAIGGQSNLVEGTSKGSWTAAAIEESSVYANTNGNSVLFAGTGAYELEANLSRTATLSDGVDISLDFAICRTGGSPLRRNTIAGVDEGGQPIFKLWLSGYNVDGVQTLYLESASSTNLLASGIARSASSPPDNFDLLEVVLDETGIAVSLNGTELTHGVPLYTSDVQNLAKLVFEGDSTWYDNIEVLSPNTILPAYAEWAASYGLIFGAQGSDDYDGALNLYEYAMGGNPINPLEQGFIPTLRTKADGGTNRMEFIHVQRSGSDSGLNYYLELSDNLVSNVWTTNGYTVIGSGPFTNGFDAVTNRIQSAVQTRQFIRLIIEER